MLYYLAILKEKCDCFKDKEKREKRDREILDMISDIVKTQTDLIELSRQIQKRI